MRTQIDSVCCFDDSFRYSDLFLLFAGELDLFSLCVISGAHISADVGKCWLRLTRFVVFMMLLNISTDFLCLSVCLTCFHRVLFLMVIFRQTSRAAGPN